MFRSFLTCAGLVLAHRASTELVLEKPLTSSASYDEIDAYIERVMRRLRLPGVSLAIVEGDQIVYLRGFGRARPDGEMPTPQTPFFIGSLTKSFTALAVMQLVEAGKIDLDAAVQRYLPWFRVADPQASVQITVRHLLNQTSGFSQPTGIVTLANFDDSPDATERQARALATCKLARLVGSAFEYSNTNYNLLGLIIEAVSGESYQAYIQHHVFDPLEMRHSYTSKAAAKQDGLAVGHQLCFGLPIPVPDLPVPIGSFPSGQLISSAEEMAHYLIAHLNQGRYGDVQILSPSGMAELHRPAVDVTGMRVALGKYGMGWMIEEPPQGRRISHKGTVPDFFAYMALLPEQNRGVVLLINANQLLIDFVLAQVSSGVTSLLTGTQPKPVPMGIILWILRGFLLIPALQIAGVTATLRLLRRWRVEPDRRPSAGRAWWQHILLPLIPNLSLAAVPFFLRVSSMLRSMLLFTPDISWIALICGCVAGLWAFLRTGLILRALRKPQESQVLAQRLSTEQYAFNSSITEVDRA